MGLELVAVDGSDVVPGQGLACRRRSLNRSETNFQFAIVNFTFSMTAHRITAIVQFLRASLPGV
ncbi:hypothetical protein RBSWK_05629 [Rhodopirellula baltica SWK14]|uniref:Uncharacterized protein n=1 Tax=Rhodopirellula baltica SWK14 TaxID=993516 RepID=L7C9P5_RHOBT|nr:hypothetical protein RBSWK_05629 [Rhodopirellula baltica SWK14]